jgi:hypothetical protein
MIRGAILIYGDVNDPVHCDDIFSFESPKDPSTLTSLEAIVDTREMTLSFLGDMFPNMKSLRLNNSIIPSVRDIGCTLVSLHFLSLARCNISSLDGIQTLSRNLEELYLAFNHLTDVCDLMGMEHLKIVDLEDNQLPDISAIEILSLCPCLKALTLSGNPGAEIPDYRQRVRLLLPQLTYLDEKRLVPKDTRPKPPLEVPQLPIRDDEAGGGSDRIMSEMIDDIVADRPPTSRESFQSFTFPEFSTPAGKLRGGATGHQKLLSGAQKRIITPMSARVRPF